MGQTGWRKGWVSKFMAVTERKALEEALGYLTLMQLQHSLNSFLVKADVKIPHMIIKMKY